MLRTAGALLCAGIGVIAMCLIVPATDDNRQLLYQREKLKADLAQIQKQVEVNNDFLKKLGDDPTRDESEYTLVRAEA